MVAGIYSRTRIVRMLEVRRKLHTSVDHTPATPVWLFASEHSATSLHTWELHSARFAKLNTLCEKVVISPIFCQVIKTAKERFLALRGLHRQIQAESGSDGTLAKEFPSVAPLHPSHNHSIAMNKLLNKVLLRETPQRPQPFDSDR